MAKKTKKSTLTKVGEAVKDAAQTVAAKADEYIVTPVSNAVGAKTAKKPAKSAAAKKTSTAKTTKSAATKSKPAAAAKPAPAKKAAAKRPAKGK